MYDLQQSFCLSQLLSGHCGCISVGMTKVRDTLRVEVVCQSAAELEITITILPRHAGRQTKINLVEQNFRIINVFGTVYHAFSFGSSESDFGSTGSSSQGSPSCVRSPNSANSSITIPIVIRG